MLDGNRGASFGTGEIRLRGISKAEGERASNIRWG